MDLSSPVTALRGVGPTRAAALHKLGADTLFDLLRCFPRGYEDRTRIVPIAELQPGEGVKNTYYHAFTADELDGIVRGNGCTVLYIQTLDDIFVQSYADLFTDRLAAAQSGETLLYRVTDAGFAPMQMEVSAP